MSKQKGKKGNDIIGTDKMEMERIKMYRIEIH